MIKEEQKNIGTTLTDALRTKGLTVEKLAQLTGISDRFIESLLEERYEKLPPAPYLRGYILKISEVLNIDGKEIWKEYKKFQELMKRSGSKDTLPQNRFENAKVNKKIVLATIIVLLLAYFLIEIPAIVGKPQIYLDNFEDNLVVSEAVFTIVGKIKPTDILTINNERVYVGENGEFSKKVNLNPGLNAFVFEVKRPLGKKNVVVKQIYYESPKTTN
jgi:lambda repressor-like predicted transcriptional regulator